MQLLAYLYSYSVGRYGHGDRTCTWLAGWLAGRQGRQATCYKYYTFTTLVQRRLYFSSAPQTAALRHVRKAPMVSSPFFFFLSSLPTWHTKCGPAPVFVAPISVAPAV